MIIKSIATKLALTSVAIVFAAMASFGVFSYLTEKTRLEKLIDRNANLLHQRLIYSLKSPLYQFDDMQINAVILMEMQDEDVSSIVLKDEKGKLIAAMSRNERNVIQNLTPSAVHSDKATQCYRMLSGPIQVEMFEDLRIIGKVDLCISDTTLKKSLHSLIVSMMVQTLLLALLLCLCIIVGLNFVLLKPIMIIRDAVACFALKDFSSRCSLQSNDELGELGKHFNNMAATIQDHRDNLERTIEDRTIELLRKNEIIVLEKELAETATRAKTQLLIEQESLISKLADAQGQLLQSEKLASVGQLAAGVAHEINNPIGFINSNLGSLKRQVDDLLSVISVYQRAETALTGHLDLLEAINKVKSAVDLAFLQEDIQKLIAESLEGIHRVKKIVDNLKDFSRVDSAEWQCANLEQGLESTLNIVWNEIKYKAEVKKEYAGSVALICRSRISG